MPDDSSQYRNLRSGTRESSELEVSRLPLHDDRYDSLLVELHDAVMGDASTHGSSEIVKTTRQDDADLGDRLAGAEACLRLLERMRPHQDASDVDLPQTIGRFQIKRLLGHGTYGVVYQAYDPKLQRDVAIKVPRPEVVLSPPLRNRFLREAEAAASLDHPNIVRVYEAGQADGVYYTVMAYCEGRTLGQWLREQPDLPRSGDAARLVATLADAIAHAHSRGVLHRDLKPSNVLLSGEESWEWRGGSEENADESSELSRAEGLGKGPTPHSLLPTPLITDFGLAKFLGDDSSQTHSSSIVGTPSYMSPEQASGENSQIGTATDVYALGAILFELLTGKSPFNEDTVGATLDAVRARPAPPPSRQRADVPRDLDAICLKCLEKEPTNRYRSATELSDDLSRYLNQEPIAARPAGNAERVARWSRRNPVLSGLTAAVLLLIVGLIAGTTTAAILLANAQRKTLDSLDAEIDAREEAGRNEELARRIAFEARVAEARGSRTSGRPEARGDALDAVRKAASQIERLKLTEEDILPLRNEAIAAMSLIDLRVDRRWPGHPPRFEERVALDADAARYARLEPDGQIVVRSMDDNRQLASIPGLGEFDELGTRAFTMFSTDGQFLVVRGMDKDSTMRVQVWKLRPSPDLIFDQEAGGSKNDRSFDLSSDNRQLVFATSDGTIAVHDLETRGLRRQIPLGWTPAWLKLSPNGKTLAVVSGDKRDRVILVDVATGETDTNEFIHPQLVYAGVWSHDGRLLATACTDAKVYVWDIQHPMQPTVCEGHRNHVGHVAFANRSSILASSSWDMTTRLWDPRTGRQLLKANSWATEFSRSDQWLGLADSGIAVGRWRFTTSDEVFVLPGSRNGSFAYGMAYSPDGRLLASAGQSDGVRIWDTNLQREIAHLNVSATSVRFSPNGSQLLVGGRNTGIQRWPLKFTGDQEINLRIGPPEICETNRYQKANLSVSGDHKTAVLNLNWDTAGVYDLESMEKVRELTSYDFRFHAVSPDSKWIAAGSWRGDGVKIFSRASGELEHELPVKGSARVVFSPSGRWLVTCSNDRFTFWSVGSWQESHHIEHDGFSFGYVAFPRTGNLVAVSLANSVKLIDQQSGKQYATLMLPDHFTPRSLAFSPEGHQLAVASTGKEIQVWQLDRIRKKLTPLGLDWKLPPYAKQDDQVPKPIRAEIDNGR